MIICKFIILWIVVVTQGYVTNADDCQAPDKGIFPFGPDSDVPDVPAYDNGRNLTNKIMLSQYLDPNAPEAILASYGLYLYACGLVQVVIGKGFAVPNCPGLAYQVDIHTNVDNDDPNRPNDVSVTKAITSRVTTIKSTRGGIVYIRLPRNCTSKKLSEVNLLSISPLYRIPIFVQGKTDIKKWDKKISKRNTPWAEVGSYDDEDFQGGFVFTYPTKFLQDIPGKELEESLVDYKNAFDALYEITGKNKSVASIRITFDRFPNNGKGYPIILEYSNAEVAMKRNFLKTTEGDGALRTFTEYFTSSTNDSVDDVMRKLYAKLGR